MAKKVDGNHTSIVEDLRRLGFSVWDTHTVGKGGPDVIVGIRLHNILVEIKDGKNDLNEKEKAFKTMWRGPYIVARCAEDVISYFEFLEDTD